MLDIIIILKYYLKQNKIKFYSKMTLFIAKKNTFLKHC